MLNQQPGAVAGAPATAVEIPSITLISASQTGNARRVAEALRDDLLAAGLNVNRSTPGIINLSKSRQKNCWWWWLLRRVKVNPQKKRWRCISSCSRKSAEAGWDGVCRLWHGDTSYEFFCQSGKDFDSRLAELGAERLLDRVDADVEYRAAAAEWRARIVDVLKARVPKETSAQAAFTATGAVNDIHTSPYTKEAPLAASLSVNQKITGRDSEKTFAISKSISATRACAISPAMRWASGIRTIRRL